MKRDPFQRKAESWWRSVVLMRQFLERIDILEPLKPKRTLLRQIIEEVHDWHDGTDSDAERAACQMLITRLESMGKRR